ncbi:MAG TPA: DUF2505 domain-containing protein [Acidimicrobiales bacterium]|nr:DUF2505 domain-containing protein [Acidimicrobiales bacterium]
MHFELEQQLPGSVEAVLGVLVDPDFVPRLEALPRLGQPELLEHHADDGEVRQRVRHRFVGDLPGPVTAVLDPARLTWVEEVTYDLGRATASFLIVPDHYADRLTCHGSYVLAPVGAGTCRRVSGELKVRYPLVGRTVERAILSGIEEHLAGEATLIATTLGPAG